MRKIYRLFLYFFSLFSLLSLYAEPEVPSSSPLPSSLQNLLEALHNPYIYQTVNVISGEYCESETDWKGRGPNPFMLKRGYTSQDILAHGWHFNHPNIMASLGDFTFQYEKQHFLYTFDEQSRLNKVERNSDYKTPILHLSYEEESSTCTMTTDTGENLLYTFLKYEEPSRVAHPYLLEKVEKEGGWVVQYYYQDHPRERKKLLTKREEPEGRYLITEYYDSCINPVGDTWVPISDPTSDPRIGKVKLQKAPIGIDETPLISQSFFYEENKTEVRDALGHKTLFYYGKEGKLTAIENYDEKDTLYRKERFVWDVLGQLKSRWKEDGNENAFICQTFTYDENHQVLSHTLYGNLSGKGKEKFTVSDEGELETTGVESYSIWYTYAEDTKKILSQVGDDHTFTRYFYDDSTGLMTAKFSGEGEKVRLRHFYRYNQQNHLIETIVDDGPENISQRHITRFSLNNKGPSWGMPKKINSYYLNIENGKERKAQTIRLAYNEKGQIENKSLFDKQGNSILTFSYCYDIQGRLIYTSDTFGNIEETSYDLHGNPLYIKKGEEEINNTYDFSNRLIKQEIKKNAELQQSYSFFYDLLSNKTGSQDRFGNLTEYFYDSFGRKIEEKLPLVSNEIGEAIFPLFTYQYDIFDRITTIIDPKKHITNTYYNVRGKPHKITYPDGSQESFEYFLNGSIKKATQKNGCSIAYERDFLGRVILETHYDKEDNIFKTKNFLYSSFHLLEETSQFGEEKETIKYTYDGKGRLVTQEGDKKQEFKYDALGQIQSVKEWFGEDEKEYSLKTIERESNNKVFSYSIWDSKGRLLKKEEVPSNQTTFPIQESITNSWGQEVLKASSVDKNGIICTTTHDALERPISVEKKNSFGDLLSYKEIRYDAVGNKAYEAHYVSPEKAYVLSWEWGPSKRLEKVSEEDMQATEYCYDAEGHLIRVIKPDGVELDFTSNSRGLIEHLKSSDDSINYFYSYDLQGRIIEVKDNNSGEITERKYHSSGALSYEKLGNGMTFHFNSDRLGRKKTLTLPDNSKIDWKWDGAFLRSIERLSKENAVLYTHQYTSYDLSGKLLKQELIQDLGEVLYHYGEEGLEAIVSPFWNQNLQRDSNKEIHWVKEPLEQISTSFESDAKGQIIQEKGSFDNQYDYDALYNITRKNDKNYEIDSHNQLLKADTLSFTYDANGSLIKKSEDQNETHFVYDALGRLLEASQENQWKIQFHYDPFGRRLSKTMNYYDKENIRCQKTEYYLWDGEDEIGACDETGKIFQLRVLGKGLGAEIGAAIAIELNQTIFAPIHDLRGSVTCLLDATKNMAAAWYRYGAFGEEKSFYQDELIENPYRFMSKRIDNETGLVFFGKRYYLPEIGRWITKDPLGTPDSANRYAYALNQPLTRLDLYGLFSFDECWEDFTGSLVAFWQATCNAVTSLQQHLGLESYFRPQIEECAQMAFGETYLRFAGFYQSSSGYGVHGQGEISDKVRVTLINGMMNIRADYKYSLDVLSHMHGGINIHYVFDASEGWGWDLLKAIVAKMGHTSSLAYQLAENWRGLIEEMGGVGQGGLIVHYAHSIGSVHTKAALNLLTPEERAMIQVYTFGAPQIIENIGLHGVTNFVSYQDGVPLFDPVGFITGLLGLSENIVMLGTPFGVPFSEHFFCGGSYYLMLQILGNEFLETHLK